MKLLFDGRQADNQSGTGRYTTELAVKLAGKATLEFRAIWPRQSGELRACLPGSSILECDTRPGIVGGLKRIRLLNAEWRSFRPDIAHFPANIGPFWKIRRSKETRLILTLHDVSFLHNASWFPGRRAVYYRLAAARSVGLASRVITDSEASAHEIMRYLDISASRIDVIPLGVGKGFGPSTEEECRGVRERLGLPGRFFLFVGTLEPRKNIERIVGAWSRIAEECEEDLVIAGRPGWKTRGIFAAIRESKFSKRIHCPGHIEGGDLPALYGAARALVWPSLYEGFGLPVLEAMACGTPVLCSNTPSLQELAGDSAVVVDALQTEAIADGMLCLAGDDELHARLRTSGRERAKLFSWERCAEGTLESYRLAVAG